MDDLFSPTTQHQLILAILTSESNVLHFVQILKELYTFLLKHQEIPIKILHYIIITLFRIVIDAPLLSKLKNPFFKSTLLFDYFTHFFISSC